MRYMRILVALPCWYMAHYSVSLKQILRIHVRISVALVSYISILLLIACRQGQRSGSHPHAYHWMLLFSHAHSDIHPPPMHTSTPWLPNLLASMLPQELTTQWRCGTCDSASACTLSQHTPISSHTWSSKVSRLYILSVAYRSQLGRSCVTICHYCP